MFWFQINETPTAQVVSLVESSAFADNFVLEATAHPNWAELQLSLLGTPPKDYVEAEGKNAQRRWIQLVINQAMANGFRGKICVVLPMIICGSIRPCVFPVCPLIMFLD